MSAPFKYGLIVIFSILMALLVTEYQFVLTGAELVEGDSTRHGDHAAPV